MTQISSDSKSNLSESEKSEAARVLQRADAVGAGAVAVDAEAALDALLDALGLGGGEAELVAQGVQERHLAVGHLGVAQNVGGLRLVDLAGAVALVVHLRRGRLG